MSYRDSLIQMNLDDATDIVFSYTTERDVWFTEDVNEEDTIVNRTDSFDVWWKIVNAPGFEQHLRNALLNAVEYADGKKWWFLNGNKVSWQEVFKNAKTQEQELNIIIHALG